MTETIDYPLYQSMLPQHISEKIFSLALPNLNTISRQQFLAYFKNTWALTDTLFSSLVNEEAFYRPPTHQLRHPLIFYYCHPATLYVNKLRISGMISHSINPYFEKLFETGVDEMSWDDLSKNQMKWPAISEISDYRKKVYHLIIQIIETHPAFDELPITMEHPLWALCMGMEHERIHLETSSVLIRELPIHLVKKPNTWPDYFPLTSFSEKPLVEKDFPKNIFKQVEERTISFGKQTDWPSYGWDNEYGKYERIVKSFRATQFLISNGEFYEFVMSGGYQEPRFWSEQGWKWRAYKNAKWPSFWVPNGPAGLHQYQLRLCFDIVPMQWSWPVDVNYHEAKAYSLWRSEKDKCDIPYRLLTEAEHHCLRNQSNIDPIMHNHSLDMRKSQVNLNLAYASQSPVNAMTESHSGFNDVFGNAWEWCEDHFSALSGFKVHHLYDDFSTPCFDGKHHLIMGGSFISTGDEASIFARFHFRPHFFQHASFRLVQPSEEETKIVTTCMDAPAPHVGPGPCCSLQSSQKNIYETENLLNQYLLLHYGDESNTLSNNLVPPNSLLFPKRCAELLIRVATQFNVKTERALDLGCAVGGASFELARTVSEVIGIDLSESFIHTANRLKKDGKISMLRKEEGEIVTPLTLLLDDAIDKSRIQFQLGDACSLPADLGEFDLVLMGNLLCRLPSPKSCLMRMSGPLGIVKVGGLLLNASPFSWLDQYTPKEAWIGGRKINDKNKYSSIGLHEILSENFELLHEENMPLLIREHARKFEYVISHATVWRRFQ